MKTTRLWLQFLVCLAMGLVMAQAKSDSDLLPKYRALVIGINQYANHGAEGWSDLHTARQDAEAVADLLEKRYGFEVTRLLDEQATLSAIMMQMDKLVDYSPDDAVLIYYAGHGHYDQNLGEGFWIPSDAHQKIGGQYARQDWIWNAALNKMIGASQARHVLVIADSCYGGSLFRGDAAAKSSGEVGWYYSAMNKPSRYLIASGDLEPVYDDGARHSVFAQMLLNYLQYQDKGYFAASEIGLAVRDKVSEMTGQMVRMGPLPVPTDAGGEFVFVSQKSDFPALAGEWRKELPDQPKTVPAAGRDRMGQLRDIALLDQRGASNTVRALIERVSGGVPDPLAETVLSYVRTGHKQQKWAETQALIEKLRDDGETTNSTNAHGVQPRVLAMLEPIVAGGGEDREGQALLYEIALWSALKAQDRVKIVEREVLQDALRELQLSDSNLSDPRARLVLGRLFPAGSLLSSKILASREGDKIMIRLIDTQTSEVLAILSESIKPDDEVTAACKRLADAIVDRLIQLKPLKAAVTSVDQDVLTAPIGRFQQAHKDMTFTVLKQDGTEAGEARLTDLGEEESRFQAIWKTSGAAAQPLWISEKVIP
ncbi:MAG TPA: hypothetical protein DCZ95_11685 [Verrucomicrobia bacterium]|nr:MAG: hypothetical protein A2X46_01740 [Lentisphaerae bacterium GWF2_57_35]HBA84746.1 hypothetical protein [Verrucomicrobiota bacterium]